MKKYLILVLFSLFYAQDEFLVTVPATSYSDWIYFSIEQNSVVDIPNPENSLDWDLAFQRKHIRTNSGLSGSGNGGAYVDSLITWSDEWGSLNEIPQDIDWLKDEVHYDFYDLVTHTFVEGIKNPALNAWGWFNPSYQLIPTNYVFFVKAANGEDVIKFWAYDYYQNGAGGNVSFRYQTGFTLSDDCVGLTGDVNLDDTVNILDIVAVVQFILGNIDFDQSQICLSDLNSDETVNVLDIVALVQSILGG